MAQITLLMKNAALLTITIIVLLLVEVSAVAHPIERILLRASGVLMEYAAPFDKSYPEALRDARTILATEESAQLKAQLNFRTRTEANAIGARVSGYTTDPVRSPVIIDRGKRDGVAQGAPVIAGDGLLIGVIQAVAEATSIVLPLHDPRSSILARIPSETREVHGIAKGRFNVGVDLTFIPITEELRVGDIVVTSGLQTGIPQGLVIGTIREVRKKPEDLFQSAIIDIPYAARPPLYVSVLLYGND